MKKVYARTIVLMTIVGATLVLSVPGIAKAQVGPIPTAGPDAKAIQIAGSCDLIAVQTVDEAFPDPRIARATAEKLFANIQRVCAERARNRSTTVTEESDFATLSQETSVVALYCRYGEPAYAFFGGVTYAGYTGTFLSNDAPPASVSFFCSPGTNCDWYHGVVGLSPTTAFQSHTVNGSGIIRNHQASCGP